MATSTSAPLKVLLYLVSEDWYFLSHRLPMARAAHRAGFAVHVATRIGEGRAAIESEGFTVHPMDWRRGSTNPLDLARAVRAVRRLLKQLEPALVHQVALWPSVVGSLAGLGLPGRQISALAGLGFAFTSDNLKARAIRMLLRPLLRALFDRPGACVLVQNPDDAGAIAGLGVSPDRIAIIPGSGVDTQALQPLPEPDGPPTMAYVGRLLADKGLRTLITAQQLLANQGLTVPLLLAGQPDPANPASIPLEEIERWRHQPGVTLMGQVADIRSVWAQAHIAVLPSRREGLPKSLLEAAACGRPMVATDVPGCREIARPGVNAVLVPPDDPGALAEAIATLVRDPALRRRYGTAGRQLVEAEFSNARIEAAILALYERLT